MAYQKLQTQRAIPVFPTDDVTVPSPSDLAASGVSSAAPLFNSLVDSTASFSGKVKPGATIYNMTNSTAATVVGVSDTTLTLSANIFFGSQLYKVYNTDNSDGPVLYVGTGGTLSIITVGGDSVTLTNVADGSFIPIMIGAVQNTGTSASGIIALW